MTAALMIQGAGSGVGKSLLVAGLCRVFAAKGLKVRPFKPQNMSNNAAVTCEGGEIGRAQALQAQACFTEPSIHMNPILLKPESESGAQVIVQGERVASMSAREYTSHKASLLPKVLESFGQLKSEADLVIVEGAGSPAEVNLRENDIANMGFAEAADVPVVLVGDINRGGVIASLVGTAEVLSPEEKKRIKGFLINKFRGDKSLFADGMKIIEERTKWQNLGLVTWFEASRYLPAEDILDLENKADKSSSEQGSFHIAVPILNRIANLDDIDPLLADERIKVSLIKAGEPLPMDADLVLLLGSKAVIGDLVFLRKQGWDIDLQALRRKGAVIIGLCGGYQMLGRAIHDPLGLEGKKGSLSGLGLLDVETTLAPEKILKHSEGVAFFGDAKIEVSGYEIHLGVTIGADTKRPMLRLKEGATDGKADGAISTDGKVQGCYLHGLFESDSYRQAWIKNYGGEASNFSFDDLVEKTLQDLAKHLEENTDIEAIAKIAEQA